MLKKQLIIFMLLIGLSNLSRGQSTSIPKQIGPLKWKFKASGKLYASPTLSKNHAFIGSEDGNLYAIDLKSGKKIWSFKTGGAVSTTPALSGDVVYIGSADGNYYAVNALSGTELWRFATGGQQKVSGKGLWGMQPADEFMEDQYDVFVSSPAVYGHDNDLTICFGSSDGFLYAVDKDGKLKWKFKTNGIIRSTPVFYNDKVYFGSWDTYVYALDAASGSLVWKFKTKTDELYQGGLEGILASPQIANGNLYIGARDGFFYALDAENGKLQWKFDAENAWIVATAAVRDGIVYVTTSDTYLFIAFDALTGEKLYAIKTNGYNFSPIALQGNYAFFGDFSGKLFQIDLTTKSIAALFETEGRKSFKKVILDDKEEINFAHIAGDRQHELYKTTVHLMDELYKLGPFVGGPVILDNVLYVASTDGNLYALGL